MPQLVASITRDIHHAVRTYYLNLANDDQHMNDVPSRTHDTDEPALLRKVLEASPSFLHVLHGPNFVVEYANEAYYRLVGRRDLIGRPAFEAMPEAAGEYPQRIAQVMATRLPFHGQEIPVMLSRTPSAPPEERWIDLVYVPLIDADGKCQRVLGHGTDVTENVQMRRQAEQAERLSSDRLADALLAGRMIAWEWNVQTDVLTSSGARLDLFESEGGMFASGKTAIQYVHPDDQAARVSMVKASLAGLAPWHLEYRTLRTDGSVLWLEERANLSRHPENGQQLVVGLTWDITQRKQAQEALELAEQERQATANILKGLNATLEAQVRERTAERDLFVSIIERTDTLVMAAALDYTILAINPATANEFERVYGVRPEVGDNLLGLLADQPEHQAQVKAGWSQGLTGQEITIVEDYGDPRRTRPYYEIKFRPLHNEQGALIGCYQFVSDITQRLRDQASLTETQEALRQSQKMEAVGQLTGGVAHDFNNLLTVIKSSTELLKRPNLPDDRRSRYLMAISTTVDRAAKLTGQLLAFARRQALRPEVFAACDSVRSLSAMMETLIGAQSEIVTELPEHICYVNADASQFDTALVNMAVNARDATDGQGRVTIRVEGVEGVPANRTSPALTGTFVAVSIGDTGIGIPAERLEQIFEPFFTTKAVGQGTGLGLSQVYGFAKQSGGEVRVDSELGKGSVFTLYLPRAVAPEQLRKADEPEPLMDGHGTCVLVVEDNVEVGNFAVQTLTDLGYKTVLANNAQEALAELAKNADRFDVVFSDVVMPGMNGIDLAHEIRRQHHDLPVLLASGYSHVLAQNGTYGFELLHKPYSVEELSRLLRKVASWQRRKRIIGK